MAKSKKFKTEVNSIPAGGQWECQLELDGEACGIIISNDAQLMYPNAQHFWDIHPASCFGGIHLHNLVTGEDVLPMEDFEPLDDWTVRFLKAILPAAVADFRKPQFLSARDFIRNYAGSKDNLDDAVVAYTNSLDDVHDDVTPTPGQKRKEIYRLCPLPQPFHQRCFDESHADALLPQVSPGKISQRQEVCEEVSGSQSQTLGCERRSTAVAQNRRQNYSQSQTLGCENRVESCVSDYNAHQKCSTAVAQNRRQN